MKIAVTTPTGNVGSKLVEQLLNQGQDDLVLLARDPNKLAAQEHRSATVVQGDLLDEAFVLRATKGTDALFYVIPPRPNSENLRQYQREVATIGAKAARENRIGKVVLLSAEGAQFEHGTGPILGLRDAEAIFQKYRPGQSTLVVLRPTVFMENFLYSLESIIHESAIYMPIGCTHKMPFIATSDVASAAAQALTEDSKPGVDIRSLAGKKTYTYCEASEIIGSAIGRDVQFRNITQDQARQWMLSIGMSRDVADRFVQLYTWLDQKGFIANEETKVITTETTLEDFAHTTIAPAVQAHHH